MSTTPFGAGESPHGASFTADHGGHGMSTPHSTVGEWDYRGDGNRGSGNSGFRGHANTHLAHPDHRAPRLSAHGPSPTQ